MSVVVGARVEEYLKYCSGVRLSQTMQRQVALFLAKLSGATDAATVEYLCREEKGKFEAQYQNDNTRAAHMTKYRKGIASMTADRSFPDSVLYEQETVNGVACQHLALKWMNYSSEFHAARQAPTKEKTSAQRRGRVAFEPQPVIDAAVAALSSDSSWEVAAAIILLTGRRPTEILKTAAFEQVGAYQLAFTGQLKRRDQAESEYEIYCLCRTHLLIDAFTRFRRIASIRELQQAENTAVDSRLNATVNRAVRAVFLDSILPAPLGEEYLSAKNLRAAYTNIAYHLFGSVEVSIGSFAEDFLGHQSVGSAANYEDYYCVDANGHPSPVGLLRAELAVKAKRPQAAKRTTVHVDGLLQERFAAFGEGTHKQKMVQLLDAAERNERLDRQLHSTEQRLKLARDHIELLQQQVEALKQAQTATQTKNEPAPAHTPIPDDWTEMSNAELNGSQIPGSADEKVRRSIEAFYEFNEERAAAERWSITPTVIKKLSGSNANRVRYYLDHHPQVVERLEQYNSAFGYHQNKGKSNPRDTIKWPASYGEYEW